MRRTFLTLGTAGAAAAIFAAAHHVAFAPPDPELDKRARAAQFSGPWTHGYANVNGVRLHYAEVGSGPLVILLHGFPQCWYAWRHVMTRLSPYYRLVAPDMRGYNWSDKPEGVSSYSLDKVSMDVVGLIEALGESRAHVVGHDWGGGVAWHLGAYHPEHLNKLAVINAPHPAAFRRELQTPDQKIRSLYVFFFQLPVLPEAVVRLSIGSSLRNSASIPGAFSDEALDVYKSNLSQPGTATAMLNYYRAAFRQSARYKGEAERPVNVPTLHLWGMKDFALSPRLIEGLNEWVPDLRIERAEDSNHWVPEEKPRWVADRLGEFLTAFEVSVQT